MLVLEAKQQNLLSDSNSAPSGSLADELIENIHFENWVHEKEPAWLLCPHFNLCSVM